MPYLQRATRRRKRVPVGDLDTEVRILNREQRAPAFGATDTGWTFTDIDAAVTYYWAKVETSAGRTVFNGVDRERRVSHIVTVRKPDARLTAAQWIRLPDGTLLDVLETEDLDQRGEFVECRCEASGDESIQAAGL